MTHGTTKFTLVRAIWVTKGPLKHSVSKNHLRAGISARKEKDDLLLPNFHGKILDEAVASQGVSRNQIGGVTSMPQRATVHVAVFQISSDEETLAMTGRAALSPFPRDDIPHGGTHKEIMRIDPYDHGKQVISDTDRPRPFRAENEPFLYEKPCRNVRLRGNDGTMVFRQAICSRSAPLCVFGSQLVSSGHFWKNR